MVESIRVNGRENVLSLYVGSEDMAVKESYVFNAAFVTKRFKDLETLDKTTFNAHKLIDLSRKFEDASETVIAVFGLISIVAAVLQIVDLMQGGSMGMMTAMACSCVGVVLLVVSWVAGPMS